MATIENVFTGLLWVASAYAACGAVVAALFLARWYRTFDPSAAHGTWGFRVLVAPGIVMLWPVVLAKALAVRRGESAEGKPEAPVRPETLRRNHALAILVLALAGPLLFAVALIWRAPELPRSGGVPPPASQTKGRDAPSP